MGPPVAPETLPISPRRVNSNLNSPVSRRRTARRCHASRESLSHEFQIRGSGPFLFDGNSLQSFLTMAVPPKKPQTGRAVPRKPGPPTRRSSGAPGSGRVPTTSAPAKNNLPLILGLAGGVLAIAVIAFVAFSGADEHKAERGGKSR